MIESANFRSAISITMTSIVEGLLVCDWSIFLPPFPHKLSNLLVASYYPNASFTVKNPE